MMDQELNTSIWNLPVGVAAASLLTACGPFILIDDTGYYDTTMLPETTSPGPGPGPDVDTTPVACNGPEDCPPGFICDGGSCIPSTTTYYSDDVYYDTCGYYDGTGYGGCCRYDCDTDTDSDSDTYGGFCSSHYDCGPGLACNQYEDCVYVPVIPPCDATPEIVPLALPTMSVDAFVSLAFVDADGDSMRDLVVGRSGSAELLLGPGDGAPIPLPVPPGSSVVDATGGDLDDDGQAELVLSTQAGTLHVLASDGAGGYVETVSVQEIGPMVDLGTLQWNGDGLLDLVGRVEGDQARVYWGDGAGGFAEVYSLVAESPVVSLALADLEGDADGDVVLQDQAGAKRFEGSNAGNLSPDGQLPGGASPRVVLTGSIGSSSLDDVVGFTVQPRLGGTLLELWPDALESPQYYYLFIDPIRVAALGDVHADGSDDVVLGGETHIDYVRGSFDSGTAQLSCASSYEHMTTLEAMAVGDFDGNLRADVAIGNSGGVVVLLSQ